MKQRLCIGIQHLDRAWECILDQAGVWYEEVVFGKELAGRYSAVILNQKPRDDQKQKLKNYLASGGAVLETKGAELFHDSNELSTLTVKTIINHSSSEAFAHIPFLDLYSQVSLKTGGNILAGLVHIQDYGQGMLGYLGTHPATLVNDFEYSRKRFFSPFEEQPDEIVSTVSKSELLDTFLCLLKELHHKRGLPFIRKWDSPKKEPVFCFRVDSDYGDKKSLEAVYDLAKKYDLSLSWFLHVQAHEEWLDHFKSWEKQEIALHGYEHGASSSPKKIQQNIQEGLNLLNEAGFGVDGFCAPYGIWNAGLARVLEQTRFSYSSEFCFLYDGLPIQPLNPGLPLQVPIHPVCTGSLSRKKMGVKEMESYFRFALENKLVRFQPSIFYHHPLQPGLAALEGLFREVKKENLYNMTFSGFANWWKQRNKIRFEAFFENNQLSIENSGHEDFLFQVSHSGKKFDLLSGNKEDHTLSEKPEFEYSKPYLPAAEQIKGMRTKDWKLIKTSLLDWKNRNRL